MPSDTKTHRFLRLISFLSSSYPKTKKECLSYLGIKDSAFYNYKNVLLDAGFNVQQKEGKYWIECSDQDSQILRNVLHFSEEESYLLSRCIDLLDESTSCSNRLKLKLTAFLNQDKAIEAYLHKEKSTIVQIIRKAQKEKKQILLVHYASGNSQTIKDRMVEPFEFKDDFTFIWAFDTALKQNRQFKICRIEDVVESPLSWEYEQYHQSKPVDIFRNTGDLKKTIQCTLTLKAKNLLIEEYPLAERYLSSVGNNQFELNVQVAKYEGPGRFVMGLTEDIHPIGNEGFLEYLKKKIGKCQKYFSDSMNIGVLTTKFEQK
jgi:proteasome accessory factor C